MSYGQNNINNIPSNLVSASVLQNAAFCQYHTSKSKRLAFSMPHHRLHNHVSVYLTVS